MTDINTPTGLTDSKPAVQSMTIWGAVIAILSAIIPLVAPMLGWTADTQTALVNLLGQLGVLIGSGVAIYGRLVATTSISTIFTSTKPPSGVVSALVAFACVGLLLLGAGSLSACSTVESLIAPASSTATTAVNVPALKAMIYAEGLFNAAATAEIDAKASGLLTGEQAASADAVRQKAYQVLVTLRAVYAAGTIPNVTTLLALTNQVLTLSGHATAAAPIT